MPVGTKDRKFTVYNALEVALRRGKIEKAGATSTLLLETFLEDGGRLKASKVYSRELCEEAHFMVWRKVLIQKEWLVWSESQADKGQYHPGKKLIPYINKEKSSQKEIVTKDEVPSKADFNNLKLELTDTKNRVTTIEESMKKVYSKLKLGEPDPPGYGKLQQHVIKDDNN